MRTKLPLIPKGVPHVCLFYRLVLLMAILSAGCYKPVAIVADVTPPGEVSDLAIQKLDVNVLLTWNNPGDKDLRGIRISLYNADNQNMVKFDDVPPDSSSYTFEKLAPGNYTVKIQTRDKENNLSNGVDSPFVFLSKAPVNVSHIAAVIDWNVLHLNWDSLTAEDYKVTVEGKSVTIPVDSIIVAVDSTYRRIALPATATGVVIPDLPDGRHFIQVFTHGTSGYYSAEYKQSFAPVTFGEKFVRVTGNGYDFYIARYEVTTEEYRKFIVDDLGIMEAFAPYKVDNSKVPDTAWYKWWYGTDPTYPGTLWLLGFNSWEFSLSPAGWVSNRYTPDDAFGKITWEGAMLYCLVNYNGRCPTKDEWLYAAKGGLLSKGYDYAGSNDPDAVGWWGWDPSYTTFLKPPGLKQPNELGIYDMSGNAGEILYDLDDGGGTTLGTTVIIGGSMGPIHFWGNEGEDFGPDNNIKPKLSDPAIVKHTGIRQNDARWRMGIRVLIPHEEIVKVPFNRHKYEQ